MINSCLDHMRFSAILFMKESIAISVITVIVSRKRDQRAQVKRIIRQYCADSVSYRRKQLSIHDITLRTTLLCHWAPRTIPNVWDYRRRIGSRHVYPRDRDEIFRVLWCPTSRSSTSPRCDYQYSRCVYYAHEALTRENNHVNSRFTHFSSRIFPVTLYSVRHVT